MTTHTIGTREEWVTARLELLKAEKELTRRSDAFQWRAGEEGGGEVAEHRLSATCGVDALTYHRDRPGMSAFVLEDGTVYHSYSTYARGVDVFFGIYHWLDRAPKGRSETGVWWRRHDEYDGR